MNITVNKTGEVVDHFTAMNALNYDKSGFYSVGITYDGEAMKETLIVVDKFSDHVMIIGDTAVIQDYEGVLPMKESTTDEVPEPKSTLCIEQDWSDKPTPDAMSELVKTGVINLSNPDNIQMQAFSVPEGHVLAPKGYVDVDLLIKVVETLQMKPKKA